MQKNTSKSKNSESVFKELKNKAYFLDEAQKIARFGYYVLDISSGRWEQSPGLDEVFGTAFTKGRDINVWLEIIHPDDRKMMQSYFVDQVIFQRQSFDKKYRILRPNGELVWVHGKGKLSFNGDGQPVSMFGTIQDITEQKRTEEEIQDIRHLYENLVETSQELIFQTNSEGRFIFVNKACQDILGYSHNEMNGRRYIEFLQPKESDQSIICLEKNSDNFILGKESVWLHKDGSPVYLRLNIRKIYNEAGRYNGAMGTAYNITDTIRAEQLAKEKTEELNNYFNMSLDLLAVANFDGYFSMLNPSWETVLGYSLKELKGERFFNLIHPDDVKTTKEAIRDLQKGTNIQSFVNRYKRKDGTYRHIEWRSVAHKQKIYAAARDVTEHIQLEDSLRKVNKDLSELNYQKDKFLYIIAHDLRNPLNNILGFVELLHTNFHNNNKIENYELVQLLSGNVYALYELVENLLNWALSQTGKLKASMKPLKLNVQVKRAINHLKSLAKAKQIFIENNVSEEVMVMADEQMLNTILRNLISNAIKFSYQNSLMSIESRIKEDNVFVEIRDNGVGIEKDVIPLLFQAETTRSTPGTQGEGGTGFGLPLCNELIISQGGKIEVFSKPNQGSTFVFSLLRG